MERYKYPRTCHFDFSHCSGDDSIGDSSIFTNRKVIVTEKMDGENTTIYSDGYIHARSIDSSRSHHPSRSWVKQFAAYKHQLFNDGDRICGENMYAVHSVSYYNLKSYFLLFSIWTGATCWDWETTVETANYWEIETVPVLYVGIFDYNLIKNLFKNLDYEKSEGLVCRVANEFELSDFSNNILKAVRPNHVQTNEHWMNKPVVPNILTI